MSAARRARRRRSHLVPAAGAAAVLLVGLLFSGCAGGRQEAGPSPEGGGPAEAQEPEQAAATSGGEQETVEAVLFFADESGELVGESRDLPREISAVRQARRLVEALLEGPRGRLGPVLPADASLRALHLGPDGTAYIDMDAAFARGLSRGSEDALLAVRALADTLAVNLPQVRRVKILVEGDEVRDLGGHLDLSRPLAPDADLAGG